MNGPVAVNIIRKEGSKMTIVTKIKDNRGNLTLPPCIAGDYKKGDIVELTIRHADLVVLTDTKRRK